jgi:hypothetical protein
MGGGDDEVAERSSNGAEGGVEGNGPCLLPSSYTPAAPNCDESRPTDADLEEIGAAPGRNSVP